MKSIKQINGHYLPEPDRMILRVSTLDDNEYAFLVTRRITCLLIEAFQRHVAQSIEHDGLKFSPKDIEALKQEVVAQHTDFKATYEGANKKPLGKIPHLISGIKLSQNKKKQSILQLSLRGHDPVSFFMNPQLMRITIQFLNKIQAQAIWNIELEGVEIFSTEPERLPIHKSKLH
jgi:hypothetical protein